MTDDTNPADGQIARITWDHPRVSSGVDTALWHADRQLWELLTIAPCIASWVTPEHVTSTREPTAAELSHPYVVSR